MDAISRNTASVAQDFHKAGGVHELMMKMPANHHHQLLFNNKLPHSQWTTKEAAALLHSLSNAAATTTTTHNNNNNFGNGVFFGLSSSIGSTGNSLLRKRQHSTGEDDENTPSSASSTTSTTSSDNDGLLDGSGGLTPIKNKRRRHQNVAAANVEQRRAMTAFLSKNFDLQESQYNNTINNNNNNNNNNSSSNKRFVENEDQENQVQLIRSPPAYNNFKYNSTTTTTTLRTKQQQQQLAKNHRPELFKEHQQQQQRRHYDKENQQQQLTQQQQHEAAALLTQIDYQNFNKIGTQFQNYVKDIISKYYAETPFIFPAMPQATTTAQQATHQPPPPPPPSMHNDEAMPLKKRRLLSETEEYIEYLKNKEDITLTITPKQQQQQPKSQTPNAAISIIKPHISNRQPKSSVAENLNDLSTAFPATFQQPQQQQVEQQVTSSSSSSSIATTPLTRDTKPNQRKSINQLATLLPLLADAASQQQYLTAPLDFSKKPTSSTMKTDSPPSSTTTTSLEKSESPIEAVVARAQLNTTPTNDFVLNLSCSNSNSNSSFSSLSTSMFDKRNSRKQAQPKKIRMPPEMVLTMLRDKYLNRLTGHKLSCAICAKQPKTRRHHMLVFNYHSKGSLALHHFWKHRAQIQNCANCEATFKQSYSLKLHCRLVHKRRSCRQQRRPKMKNQIKKKAIKKFNEQTKDQRDESLAFEKNAAVQLQ